MSNLIPDPTPELYRLMDEAGLQVSTLMNSKRPIAAIVNGIRTDLAMRTRSYIQRRDQTIFNAGVIKGESKHEQRNRK